MGDEDFESLRCCTNSNQLSFITKGTLHSCSRGRKIPPPFFSYCMVIFILIPPK